MPLNRIEWKYRSLKVTFRCDKAPIMIMYISMYKHKYLLSRAYVQFLHIMGLLKFNVTLDMHKSLFRGLGPAHGGHIYA